MKLFFDRVTELSNDFPGLGASCQPRPSSAKSPPVGKSPDAVTSLDGLMSSHCHEDAVIEIKCPFTWKDG